MWQPRLCSSVSTRLAIVDLPAPDRPVNHSTLGFWPLAAARAALSTSTVCHFRFAARRSAKRIIPAPTVSLEMRSTRMKLPVSRFSS